MRQWVRGLSLYLDEHELQPIGAPRLASMPDHEPEPCHLWDVLRLAAYHEAGHAAMMWWHGHIFHSVAICLDRPGIGRVQCHSVLSDLPPEQLWRRDEATWVLATEKILQEVEWSLAGPLAEARYAAEPIGPVLGSFDDVYEAIGLLGRLKHAELQRTRLTPKEVKEIYRDLNRTQERVESHLARPAIWRTVEVLAEALVAEGNISGSRASAIIQREYAEPSTPDPAR